MQVWPGSLAVGAKLLDLAARGYFHALADQATGRGNLNDHDHGHGRLEERKGVTVLELGAGSGLCSLLAASLRGVGAVVATDVSPLCLELVR